MSKKENQNSFIMQAGILAAAGIITRIIGLLYRSPLHSVIGNEGMGMYNSAYNFYQIILLVSSFSIPSAMSRVIAPKLALKEYRNAHRIFLGAMAYVLVVGAVASLFLFFGAGLFVGEETIPVLRIFAPTIFVYGMLGVLRGYFQAHKTMVQTSVSQILEQIANAVVSVSAAYFLIKNVMGTLEMPGDEVGRTLRAVNGAMGSATGTGAGVLVGLLFMAAIYGLNRKMLHRRIAHDKHKQVDSYGTIFKTITSVVTPFILSTAVYQLSGAVNNKIYTSYYPEIKGIASSFINTNWGIFGNALTISNIPVAFANAMGAAMLPSVSQLVAAGDESGTRQKIGVAVKSTMIISIPCAVGLFVLAKPVTALLFHNNTAEELELGARVLMMLALSVVFYALSTLNSSILQGLGKMNVPIINAAVALVIQTITAVGLLFFMDMNLYSIAVANTVYSGVMCILNQRAVRKAIGYKQEVARTFAIPALAAVFMGAAAWAVYEGLLLVTESMTVSVIPAILIAVVIYFVMLILLRGMTEQELKGFPKGYLLVKVAKKCKLMK